MTVAKMNSHVDVICIEWYIYLPFTQDLHVHRQKRAAIGDKNTGPRQAKLNVYQSGYPTRALSVSYHKS